MKRKLFYTITSVLILLITSFVFYRIDKNKIEKLEDPIFVIRRVKDGDTTTFVGLFYWVEKIEYVDVYPLEWKPYEHSEVYSQEDIYTIHFWFQK